VLTAITGGLTTITDIQALSVNEETATLLTCRATFDLQPMGTQLYLEWRDITRIRASRKYSVVAVHRCRGAAVRLLTFATPAEEVPGDPPF
jgi:orotate phosphoribosyltransferase-like protein